MLRAQGLCTAVAMVLTCCFGAAQQLDDEPLPPPTLPPPLCFDEPESTGALRPATRRAQDGESERIVWGGTTAQDLWNEYGNIFQYGNRNAASHRWATFIIERSWQMTPATVMELFQSFCPISGSPVRSTSTPYRVSLDTRYGTTRTGFLHHCCWPCVCDTVDFLKLDTKTIQTSEGPRQYWFTVIGNPCATSRGDAFLEDEFVSPFDGRSYTLSGVAAEVRCGDDGGLLGATLSDSGLPIIGMIHDSVEATPVLIAPLTDATPGRISEDAEYGSYNDFRDMQPVCQERAENGYASGMGEIFRQVAGVAPLTNTTGSSWSGAARVGVPVNTPPQDQRSGAALQAAAGEELASSMVPVAAIAFGAVVMTFGAVAAGTIHQRNKRHTEVANKVIDISAGDEEAGPHVA